MTPHNSAKKEDIAKTVIMPGDPLRAAWIAERYLENARLVNEVRGMFAYTGQYRGRVITVMAHGMGIPSMGIYSYELYRFYEVETIIRIGTAGAYAKEIQVGDLLIAEEVRSFSRYAEEIGVPVENGLLSASAGFAAKAEEAARALGLSAKICRVFCSETFYNKYSLEENIARAQNAAAVEMEGFALYAAARLFQRNALMLLTCSDSLVSGEAMSASERQTKTSDMARLAFETALTV
jgi:purine-nucleoside phosphorylase